MKDTKKTNSLGDATFSDIKSPKHCKFVFQKEKNHLTRLVIKKKKKDSYCISCMS